MRNYINFLLSKTGESLFTKSKQNLYTEDQVRKAYWIGVNRGNGIDVPTDDEYIESLKQNNNL